MSDGNLITIFSDPHHPKAPGTILDAKGQERVLPKPGHITLFGISFPFTPHLPGGTPILVSRRTHDTPRVNGLKGIRIQTFSLNQGSWTWDAQPQGSLEWPVSFRPVLLSEDRLLGISAHPNTFQRENRSYPFAVFLRNKKGVFEIEKMLDAGLELPAFSQAKTWNYPSLQNLTILSEASWAGDKTVVWLGCGLFWVFDAKGDLKSFTNLFKLDETYLRQEREPMNDAILGAQPSPDGYLLISSLEPDAIARYAAVRGQLLNPNHVPDGDPTASDQLNFAKILQKEPGIDWWFLNLETKEIIPTAPPKGVPFVIRSLGDLQAFNWRYQRDGNLLMESQDQVSNNRKKTQPETQNR